ncbi:unnamed protein product [Closterium sp. Yama58-4]|nr:unnamed protein product [Closterium sp. Yama58-4]
MMKARRSFSYGGSRQKLGSGHSCQFSSRSSIIQAHKAFPRVSSLSTLVDSPGEFYAVDRATSHSLNPQSAAPPFFSGISGGNSGSDVLFSHPSLDRGSSTSSAATPASPSFFSPADAKRRVSAQFGPRMWEEGGGYSALDASPERNWMGEAAAARAGFASGRRMSTSSYFQTLFRVGESCESGESGERENDFLETGYGETDTAESSCLARRSPRISSSRRSPSFFSPSRAHLPPFASAAYPPGILFRFSRSRRLSESAVCVSAVSPSASAFASSAASRPPASYTRVTPVDPWQAERLSHEALADKGCLPDMSVTGRRTPVSSGAPSGVSLVAGAAAGETRGSSRLEVSFENLSLDSDEAGSSECSGAAVAAIGQTQPTLFRTSQVDFSLEGEGLSKRSFAAGEQAVAVPRVPPTRREESCRTVGVSSYCSQTFLREEEGVAGSVASVFPGEHHEADSKITPDAAVFPEDTEGDSQPYCEADSDMKSDVPFPPRQQLSRKFCRLLGCWVGAKGTRGRGVCARGCESGRVGEGDGEGGGVGNAWGHGSEGDAKESATGSRGRLKKWWGGV